MNKTVEEDINSNTLDALPFLVATGSVSYMPFLSEPLPVVDSIALNCALVEAANNDHFTMIQHLAGPSSATRFILTKEKIMSCIIKSGNFTAFRQFVEANRDYVWNSAALYLKSMKGKNWEIVDFMLNNRVLFPLFKSLSDYFKNSSVSVGSYLLTNYPQDISQDIIISRLSNVHENDSGKFIKHLLRLIDGDATEVWKHAISEASTAANCSLDAFLGFAEFGIQELKETKHVLRESSVFLYNHFENIPDLINNFPEYLLDNGFIQKLVGIISQKMPESKNELLNLLIKLPLPTIPIKLALFTDDKNTLDFFIEKSFTQSSPDPNDLGVLYGRLVFIQYRIHSLDSMIQNFDEEKAFRFYFIALTSVHHFTGGFIQNSGHYEFFLGKLDENSKKLFLNFNFIFCLMKEDVLNSKFWLSELRISPSDFIKSMEELKEKSNEIVLAHLRIIKSELDEKDIDIIMNILLSDAKIEATYNFFRKTFE